MMLYVTTMAPNPDRVRYFLQEKGKWDAVPRTDISIMKMEHKQPDYLALSPLNQVPTLQLDDGTAITESRAICTYFDSIFPEPNLMGVDPAERARIEMWDRRVELLYFLPLAQWFRNTHPSMAELEKPQSPAWAEIVSGRVKKMAAFFNERLGASPWLAGDRFTIADITLHVALGFGRIVKYRAWDEHKNLAGYRERLLARPGLAT
jgi:glutathione S-transferase